MVSIRTVSAAPTVACDASVKDFCLKLWKVLEYFCPWAKNPQGPLLPSPQDLCCTPFHPFFSISEQCAAWICSLCRVQSCSHLPLPRLALPQAPQTPSRP